MRVCSRVALRVAFARKQAAANGRLREEKSARPTREVVNFRVPKELYRRMEEAAGRELLPLSAWVSAVRQKQRSP